MADPAEDKKTPTQAGTDQSNVRVIDSQGAPFVFFDSLVTSGPMQPGLVNITIAAQRLIGQSGGGKPSVELVVVAHLRCPMQAAITLRNMINDTILTAITPEPADRKHAN